jgi:hypothetical protein
MIRPEPVGDILPKTMKIVQFVRYEGDKSVFTVGSGKYDFKGL